MEKNDLSDELTVLLEGANVAIEHARIDHGTVVWNRELDTSTDDHRYVTHSVLVQGADPEDRLRLRRGRRVLVLIQKGPGLGQQFTTREALVTEVRPDLYTILIEGEDAATVARTFWPDLPHADSAP